jgi:uncharacterized protein YodC (DUF2158 family)
VSDAFTPGDLVQLKSGGPIMTVHEIAKHGIWTVWFAYGKRHRDLFVAPSLQPAAARPGRPPGTKPTARTTP